MLGLFGDEDRGIPPSAVRIFEQAMIALGKTVEIHMYPGAGHAFANPERPSYRKPAAEDAWEQTVAFLAKFLNR